MFSTADKNTRSSVAIQKKAAGGKFFSKASDERFFDTGEKQTFFDAGIQAKMIVSNPDDPQEYEAEMVADNVMNMTHPQMQRSCSCNGSCPSCGGLQNGNEAYIQLKPLQLTIQGQPTTPPIVQEVLSSKGLSLYTPTRSFMEQRFGKDFSKVKIHTGDKAEESAHAVNAMAYTVGQNIVFGRGQFAPETNEGKHLLAHELVHVIQQTDRNASKPFSNVLARQSLLGGLDDSTAKEPISLHKSISLSPQITSDAELEHEIILLEKWLNDHPLGSQNEHLWRSLMAMKEEEFRRKNKHEEKKKEKEQPSRTLLFTNLTAPPQGLGLRVSPHPDAVRGEHAWSNKYAATAYVNNHNKFDVGTCRLQQITMPDESGQAKVYVYYVTDAESGKKYAVGPDALPLFVMRFGGEIFARNGNSDQLATAPRSIDPRKLPTAPDAFLEEPQASYVVPRLPRADSKGTDFTIGIYLMESYLRKQPDGSLSVLYYVAKNHNSLLRPEYIMGPKWLDHFIRKLTHYQGLAVLAFPMEPGTMPPAYTMHAVRGVMGVMKGDPERAEGLKDSWIAAAKDPSWWFQVGAGYIGAVQPAPPVNTPSLRVVPGGGSAPSAGMSLVTPKPPVTTNFKSMGGSGHGASASAAVAETVPVPVVTPQTIPTPVPRPRPVGVPGWNPVPEPVAPRISPPSPIATGTIIGTLAQSGLSQAVVPAPAVKPQPDESKKRMCNSSRGYICPVMQPKLTSSNTYWNLAYDYRRRNNLLKRHHFGQNIAVLLMEGGKTLIERNESGLHSEQRLLWKLVESGVVSGCPIIGLFSERKPCQVICQPFILPQLCRMNSGVPYDVYYATEYYNAPGGVRSENNRHEMIKSYINAGYKLDG